MTTIVANSHKAIQNVLIGVVLCSVRRRRMSLKEMVQGEANSDGNEACKKETMHLDGQGDDGGRRGHTMAPSLAADNYFSPGPIT
jgi:hypothetical protein